MLGDILVLLFFFWLLGRLFGSPTSGYRTIGGTYGYDLIGIFILLFVVLVFTKVFGVY